MKLKIVVIATFLYCSAPLFGSGGGTGPARLDAALGSPMAKAREQLVDDRGFLRRVWLDLVGRQPDPQTVASFLADRSEDKYAAEIDRLIDDPMFTERWTTFFEDLFQSYRLIQLEGYYRNAFHDLVHEMVARNVPWDQMARNILTGTGPGTAPESAMFFWAKEALEEPFRLDYLDDQVGWITETMLGVQTNCISCHDGAGHLEEVNVGLSARKREEFWGMAAFLSSTYFHLTAEDIRAASGGERLDSQIVLQRIRVVDSDSPGFNPAGGYTVPTFQNNDRQPDPTLYDGRYHAESRPGQGMRPARNGGIVEPSYLFTGEKPLPGETRRQALARMITEDRQFARNLVNRVWAHFLGSGFVEPVNGWDLARIDEETAAGFGTTAQPRNIPLMEFLTDWFIDHGYDYRGLVRLIANSKLYQWDYRNVAEGLGAVSEGDPWAFWRDNRRVRRIDAEALVDRYFQVLGLAPKYLVVGKRKQVFSNPWSLPDPSEPSLYSFLNLIRDYETLENIDPEELPGTNLDEVFFYFQLTRLFFDGFGRGDYQLGIARSADDSIQNALQLFNGAEANFWQSEFYLAPNVASRIRSLGEARATPGAMVKDLFSELLFRDPSPDELSLMMEHIRGLPPNRIVTDVLWMLFNHPDFLYR